MVEQQSATQDKFLSNNLRVKKEESEPSLSPEILGLFFDSKEDKPGYEILDSSSLSREEEVGNSNTEKWEDGNRNTQNYPGGEWAISIIENGDQKTLRRDREGNFHFSGIMQIKEFGVILDDVIESNGNSVGFVDAASMKERLQKYLDGGKNKVDFSKTKVVFDFKFYKGETRYKITQAKDFKTLSPASNS